MASWLYILQPVGMILVGLVAIAYWYARKRTGLLYFLYGGILWALAIGIKVIMDNTVTRPLNNNSVSVLSITGALLVMSLYFGLRTGILENLIPYFAFKKVPRTTLAFDQVIAIGIGFGAVEAIVLGAYDFYAAYTILQKLDTLTLLSPVSLDQQSLINVSLPALERFIVLFAHVFAVALVYYSLKGNSLKLLAIAIVYMTIVDGLILPFRYYLGSNATWAIEAYLVILAIIGLAGLYWLKKKYGKGTVSADAINIVEKASR